MNSYFVIAEVNSVNYLVKVKADSLGGAEHLILDIGYCGKHTYGVTAAMSFDKKGMKTDTFIRMSIDSEPIGYNELTKLIEKRNEEIRKADEKENRINELKKAIKDMSDELNNLLISE